MSKIKKIKIRKPQCWHISSPKTDDLNLGLNELMLSPMSVNSPKQFNFKNEQSNDTSERNQFTSEDYILKMKRLNASTI